MTIEFLGRHAATHDTALLYVSDHGESLGEHGLFLHGLPYAIAPDVQTHVPMVMWLSDDFRSSRGIDESCLRARAERPATHDNVFHTVLGLLDVETSVRERSLDMTDDCRLDRAARSFGDLGCGVHGLEPARYLGASTRRRSSRAVANCDLQQQCSA